MSHTPSRSPSLSVIMPVHNGGAAFVQSVRSVVAALAPHDEVIVVADGETDGAWREAEALGLRVVRYETARGPAAARNRGAREAHGEVLLFIDADVVIPPTLIDEVRAFFQRERVYSAAFGSYDDAPAAPGLVSQYRNLLHHFTHQQGRVEASTFWAGCGAVRRAAFRAVGGFDERFRHPSVEDIELGYRLRVAGHRIRLCKDWQVKHLKRWRPWGMIRTDIQARALPWTGLLLQRQRLDNDLSVHASQRLSVVAVVLLVGALGASWWHPGWLAVAGLGAGALLVLNASFYRLLVKRMGLMRAPVAVLWHWLFFGYSGLAFAWGLGRYVLGVRVPEASGDSVTPSAWVRG